MNISQAQSIFNMPKEIEKKYLVKGDKWRGLAEGVDYRQGYLSTEPERTVRIRTMGEKAFLTIKGPTIGISRTEYEYPIPLADGNRMLDELCQKPIIEKKRYTIIIQEQVWEVDKFKGENEGLIVAEIELESEDQKIDLPDWIGEEVSHDPRYFNANLVSNPYSNWAESKK